MTDNKYSNDEGITMTFEEKGICFFCNDNPGILQENGITFCQDCLVKQKSEVFSFYMNKKELKPDYDQINDMIYLGNEDTARSKGILEECNITHILICAEYCEKFFPETFKYEILYLDDAIDEDLLAWFPKAFDFLDSCDGKCLVHCVMGLSRSVSVVIGYLMYKNHISFDKAFDLVKTKRNKITPNSGFINQLKQFEKTLIEHNYTKPFN